MTTLIVLDASAAMAFVAPSQASAASNALRARGGRFTAPWVFAVEIRNAMLKAERRGLIAPEDALAAVHDLDAIVDLRPPSGELEQIYRIARSERLSFFDACYLDLALREDAVLASRDGPMLEAATRRGLGVEDLR